MTRGSEVLLPHGERELLLMVRSGDDWFLHYHLEKCYEVLTQGVKWGFLTLLGEYGEHYGLSNLKYCHFAPDKPARLHSLQLRGCCHLRSTPIYLAFPTYYPDATCLTPYQDTCVKYPSFLLLITHSSRKPNQTYPADLDPRVKNFQAHPSRIYKNPITQVFSPSLSKPYLTYRPSIKDVAIRRQRQTSRTATGIPMR